MQIFDSHAYFTDTAFSHGMTTKENIIASKAKYGIDALALISGIAASCDFVRGNADLREVLDVSQGIYGYVTVNSDYSEESRQQQRIYMSRPEFIGAALYGSSKNPVTLEASREILNAQRRFTKPTAVYVPDAEAVRHAQAMAAEFPSMKFIFLTMGGDHWHDAVAVAKRHLNVYLELSGSLDSDKIAKTIATVTPRKLIYGSGSPFSDPELTLGLVDDVPTLTAADASRILYHNAIGLFNVQQS